MRLPFCSRRVDRHPVLSLRATKDLLESESSAVPSCPDSSSTLASLIFNSTHMLASVGSLEYPSCPVLATTCSIDLCAMYPRSSPRHLPAARATLALFIICLAGYFVSLHWPHLRLILYMLGMSDNDHRISLSIRNSYCN